MNFFQGVIARRLIMNLLGLTCVAISMSIGSAWVVQFTERSLEQILERSENAFLSIHIRSECLTLTDLVLRYIFQVGDPQTLNAQIDTQKKEIDSLIQKAIAAIDPNDVDASMQIGRIRTQVVSFRSQAEKVLQAYDDEQTYGAKTYQELTILVKNYQDPLLQSLMEYESFETLRANQVRGRARQLIQTMMGVMVFIAIGLILPVSLMGHQVLTRFVYPLSALRQGVENIRSGNLDDQVPVNTKDELGELAAALNIMMTELRQSRQKLETYAHTLEEQVAERTQEAEQRAAQAAQLSLVAQHRAAELEQYALQTQTAAEIAQDASSTLDMEELLRSSVDLILNRFGLYYVGLFLVDKERQYVWLRAATGQAGEQMLARQHKLPLDSTSMVGWCIQNAHSRIAQDIEDEQSRFANPLLPETRSEMALPLITRGEVIGALTIQSAQVKAFKQADITILQTTAGQLANAIGNARLYQEVEREKLAAEAASRAKSVFLANMSHEIRTPMNSILGFTDLLQMDKSLTLQQRENIATIHRSGEALLTLINSILDLSKIEAGHMMLNEQTFDIYMLLKNLEDLFHLRSLEKGLTLHIEYNASLPRLVQADEGRLRQVLINLIGNALKFTREGQVDVYARPAEETEIPAQLQLHDPSYSWIYFSVQDTGPGISPGELEIIFEPFTQAQNSHQFHQGTGLGLAISRQFVRLMGGEIWVNSIPGQTTLFWFIVPMQTVHISKFTTEKKKRKIIGLAAGQPTCRLLIVDDIREARTWLNRRLTALGFEVKEAANGRRAIEITQQWRPDMILMDIRMPGLDGLETTRQIKALCAEQRPIIVAATASVFEEERQEILAAGCDDFLRKPIRLDELFIILEKHLHLQLEEEASPTAKTASSLQEISIDWSEFSPAWNQSFRQAVATGDFEQIAKLAETIYNEHTAVANIIFNTAKKYDLRSLMTLLNHSDSGRNQPE